MQNLKYSLYDPVHKSLPVPTLKPCSCGLFSQLTTTFIPLLSYCSSHFLVLIDFPILNFHTSDFCLEDKWLGQGHFLLNFIPKLISVQCSSVAQSSLTLCDPVNRSTPGLPVHHQLPEFTQTHGHWVMMSSNHLILCRPLLLLPPIRHNIRVFSNESTLRMRWPKYWSFSFSIIPSKEHPGLISFRMD